MRRILPVAAIALAGTSVVYAYPEEHRYSSVYSGPETHKPETFKPPTIENPEPVFEKPKKPEIPKNPGPR